MANWLLDYIELTEYIPSELREQLTSIRELDLEVHNTMNELELGMNKFFSECNNLSEEEKQKKYQEFLNRCDVASKAANEKINVVDKLHDLVEKSMRLLDQALEKLREDLLEGDKAFIVEEIERRSQELDEQLRLEHENMLHRQSRTNETKNSNIHDKHHKIHKNTNDYINKHNHLSCHINNHRNSNPANNHQISNQSTNSSHHNRPRMNSTGGNLDSAKRHKKRERKRFNSTMTVFNRNSRSEDESPNQTFLDSPVTQEYLTGIGNTSTKKTTNAVSLGGFDNTSLTLKSMITGSNNIRNITGINDKSNGNNLISGANLPILTAIDAAHAVSPNATNSDKLVMFSSNSNNGDNYNNSTINQINTVNQNHFKATNNTIMGTNVNSLPYQQNQLSNHLLSTIPSNLNSGERNFAIPKGNHLNHLNPNNRPDNAFTTIPSLSSRHDPIMIAASQAINATQNMTPGRRTSSLKASYAAVNSGRLQTNPNQQLFDQATGLTAEVYCKCRSLKASDLIGCDNKGCKIEWFHYECVGITTPPDGEWYCDDCRVLLNSKRAFANSDHHRVTQHHHQQHQQQQHQD